MQMAATTFKCNSCGHEFEKKGPECPSCRGQEIENLSKTTFGRRNPVFKCADCGFEFEKPEPTLTCPECDSEDLEKLVKTTFGSTSACGVPGKKRSPFS